MAERARYRFMLTATMLLLTASCGDGTPNDGLPSMPPLDIVGIAAQTTAFQRELLADHQVTFAEYEKATLAAVDCMRDAGLTVIGPSPRPGDDRFLEFTYGVDPVPGTDSDTVFDHVTKTGEQCDREYLRDVARVWAFQNLLTPQQREEQRVKVIDCLQAAGVNIAGDASVARVIEDSGDFENPGVRRCREQFPAFFIVGVK